MLAIPLATLSMVMSISFLTVLNVSYNVAWPVLVALTIDTLIVLMLTFYNSCVMGVEAFDAEGKISIRKLVQKQNLQSICPSVHSGCNCPDLDVPCFDKDACC